ncbi:MAG TPA: LPXTG cell wall anchor domain-containing protein [Acidimicrobiales bacterium]
MTTALLTVAPAAAQQYPPAVNSITVDCRTPAPGDTVKVEARTFAGGSQVALTLSGGVAIGTATAGDDGVATAQVTVPADTAKGPNEITATGQAPDGSALSLSTDITVADGCGAAAPPPTEAPSGALPRTGDDSSIPLARLGLALAALGGIVMAVAAKRRRAAAAHAAA